MKTKIFALLSASAFLIGTTAHADVNMKFVPVLDSGVFSGGVGYNFAMGKTEITAGEWDAFVQGGGTTHGYTQTYQSFDDPVWIGQEKPAVKVSWYDAAQFANWKTSGSADDGAYQFSQGTYAGVNRAGALASHSTVYVIPTLNEWNKAGYFNGQDFTKFANGTETIPTQLESNYDNLPGGSITDVDVWDVGTGAEEQNKTFDMMGNVWEWTENAGGNGRYIAGGAAHWTQEQWLRYRSEQEGGHNSWFVDDGTSWLGFRIAAVGDLSAIPEPSTVIMFGCMSAGAVFVRRWFS